MSARIPVNTTLGGLDRRISCHPDAGPQTQISGAAYLLSDPCKACWDCMPGGTSSVMVKKTFSGKCWLAFLLTSHPTQRLLGRSSREDVAAPLQATPSLAPISRIHTKCKMRTDPLVLHGEISVVSSHGTPGCSHCGQ